MEIIYAPSFVRRFNKLEPDLQAEVVAKVDLFKDINNHRQLKVHKLKGKLAQYHSFSVNYRIRIVFQYLSHQEVAFLDIGDHEVYR